MRITGRQLRQIIKEEVARMMNEEDGAPGATGGYAKGSGLDGLKTAELSRMGINRAKADARGPWSYPDLPYADSASKLVSGNFGSVDRAIGDLKSMMPNSNPQFYENLKNNVTNLIYNKGNGPQLREQLKKQFAVSPSEIGDEGKASFALALLGNGKANIVSGDAAGYGRMSGAQLGALSTGNEKAIGSLSSRLTDMLPGSPTSFRAVFEESEQIRYFYENLVAMINAGFPG